MADGTLIRRDPLCTEYATRFTRLALKADKIRILIQRIISDIWNDSLEIQKQSMVIAIDGGRVMAWLGMSCR